MARINLEDSLFKDNRFMNLVLKHGSFRMALGSIVECFIVAQKFWLSHGGIPVEDWKKHGLDNLIIEVGLASISEHIVYVHGSSEQFKWLEQRAAAGAHKNHRNQYRGKGVERNGTARNGSEPLTLTLPLSHTHSLKETTLLSLKTERPFFDFDFIYKKYPRKQGKKRGCERLRVKIKTSEDYEKLSLAVDNYSRYCQLHAKSTQYVKQWSTFVSEWEDWVAPDESLFRTKDQEDTFDIGRLLREKQNGRL